MDGASAGVSGGNAGLVSCALLSAAACLSPSPAAAAAKAAALSAAAAFSAAGFSGGRLRILMLCEAQPPSADSLVAAARVETWPGWHHWSRWFFLL